MTLTGGNTNAAVLFFDIWGFFCHSKEEYKGKKIVILTDEQLSERTGLSINKVYRAKKFLLTNGYLEARAKKDPKYHQGNTVTHIHIPIEVMTLVEKLIKAKAHIYATGNEQNRITRYVQGCILPLYIEEESKKAVAHDNPKESYDKTKKLTEIKEVLGL